MTTEALSVAEARCAAMVPSRAAWHGLLWFAPLTAVWTMLIYRWPAIPASGVQTTTPAFEVPSSVLLHALSLRQLRRLSRAEAALMPRPPLPL